MTVKTHGILSMAAALILGLSLRACSGAHDEAPLDQLTPDVQAGASLYHITPPEWMHPDGKVHYNKRVKEIGASGPINSGVLLLGDSITEAWMWNDFPYDGPVANHGISWDTSAGVNARILQIVLSSPDVIFYMIGTNDLSYDHTPEQIAGRIDESLEALSYALPQTKIYLQSVLPRDGEYDRDVDPLNSVIEHLITRRGNYGGNVSFIDLTPAFSAAPEVLRPELTDDALHLNAKGYALWGEQLAPYLPK